jgi:hypothetical protein
MLISRWEPIAMGLTPIEAEALELAAKKCCGTYTV